MIQRNHWSAFGHTVTTTSSFSSDLEHPKSGHWLGAFVGGPLVERSFTSFSMSGLDLCYVCRLRIGTTSLVSGSRCMLRFLFKKQTAGFLDYFHYNHHSPLTLLLFVVHAKNVMLCMRMHMSNRFPQRTLCLSCACPSMFRALSVSSGSRRYPRWNRYVYGTLTSSTNNHKYTQPRAYSFYFSHQLSDPYFSH